MTLSLSRSMDTLYSDKPLWAQFQRLCVGYTKNKFWIKTNMLWSMGLSRPSMQHLIRPCNEPNLNGTHPALLAALRCNSDVQPPYRFPLTPLTHSDVICKDECHKALPIRTSGKRRLPKGQWKSRPKWAFDPAQPKQRRLCRRLTSRTSETGLGGCQNR